MKILLALSIFVALWINSCSWFNDSSVYPAANLHLANNSSLYSLSGVGSDITYNILSSTLNPGKYIRIAKDEASDGTGDYTAVAVIDGAKLIVEIFENREEIGRRFKELVADEAEYEDFVYQNIGCSFLASFMGVEQYNLFSATLDGIEEEGEDSSCSLLYKEAEVKSARKFVSELKGIFGELETKVKLSYSVEDVGDGESYVTLIDYEEY